MVDMIDSLIKRFYAELWEQGREDKVGEILHPSLVFRGSLGTDHLTLNGYIDYLRGVRAGLENYRCDIKSLIANGTTAAARMQFSGHHTGFFMGQAPTGAFISWAGAAFFEMRDDLLVEIWVLGDVKSIETQLNGTQR